MSMDRGDVTKLQPWAPNAKTAKMSISLVQATVPAVRKSKLQPTQPAFTLTPSAVNKIKQHLKEKPEDIARRQKETDEEVVQGGVRVFTEKKAQLTLLGTRVDYVEDKLSREFVLNNPNIKGACGCGESFTI
ncbi:iron-sulfur cluster assembly 1 homolog, mitochondrial-like [Dasypus novemcinctus]|uniref:iron-sulfur cluster assembly 1 homolog, mitochondrial-like n=1 Tax=Dasypus novemcinctus TaxID=9361 RepID=UPI0039C965B4